MLTAEVGIIQQLKTALGAMSPPTSPPARVCSTAAIGGTLDDGRLLPLVVVQPGRSDKIELSSANELSETQIWRVTVVAKVTPDKVSLTGDYQEIGRLLVAIVQALDGFEPDVGYNALRCSARLEPVVDNGIAEFELQFAARFVMSTVPATPTVDAFITHDQKFDIDTSQTGEPVAEDTLTLPQ